MKVSQLIWMLRGLEDFDLKDCGITTEILQDLNAIPMVRCKDCKWFRKPYCDKHYCCYPKSDEWFCADGERRD